MTKAKLLTEGDIVRLGNEPWTVLSNRKTADGWYLTVVNAAGMPYSKTVPGKREFDVVDRAPLHDEAGAQTRWASQDDVEQVLGGVQLYEAQTGADGAVRYTVAELDEATVAAHLLAFHNVTWEGVSLAEARRSTPDAERTLTPEQALKLADFEGMLTLHKTLHEMGDLLPVDHRHGDLT